MFLGAHSFDYPEIRRRKKTKKGILSRHCCNKVNSKMEGQCLWNWGLREFASVKKNRKIDLYIRLQTETNVVSCDSWVL